MAERRRQRPPHLEPTRVLRVPGGGFSALALALVAAMGILVGVLFIALLGGGGSRTEAAETVVRSVTVPVTVTAPAPAVTTPGPPIVTTAIPSVVGERLDVARERVERAGFDVDVDGGGTFGVVVEDNWVVVAQTPEPGASRELGSLVTLSIERA